MENKRTAAIIGAGIGGITTAIYLAKAGYKVDIYEKNLFAGGRCGQVVRDGFRFDTGATMMLMPEVYRDIFRSLGLVLEEELEVTPMDDIYKICFDDGSEFCFTTDSKRMEQQHEALEKGSYEKSLRYVETGYELYNQGFRKLLGRNFFRLFDFINLRNALLLLKLKIHISHSRYTRRFFRDRRLQMAYTFQNIYVGQSPYSAPALFSMIPAAELTEGSLFPKGGMFALTDKLLEVARREGVTLHTGREVTSIALNGRSTTGVSFADGTTVPADVVVANADLPYVYRELLPPSLKMRKLNNMKYSCSAIIFHWALNRRYEQLSHHTVYLSDSFREGLRAIFSKQDMGDDPSFYVHAPTRSDSSAAPDGCDALSVIVGTGHVAPSNRDRWDEMVTRARKAVIAKLKKAGMSDIDDQIRFEMVITPVNWQESVNVTRGAVFGSVGHNILQMGYFRPHNRDNRYKNLYFTGGSTHPGNGIPMVLMSAKLTAERILKEQQ